MSTVNQVRHKNSKIVYLRRLPLVIHESNVDLQNDYFAFASRSVGGAFAKDSDRPLTGLTIGEENLLLPLVLNIPKEDRDFRQKVTDYYHSITTRVKGGDEGTSLEIGLEFGGDEISEDGKFLNNPPLNVGQYLAYKHAIVHPEVAESKLAGKGNSMKYYYVYDPATVTQDNVDLSDLKDKAVEAYLQVKKDKKKVDMYLTLLDVKLGSLNEGEKILKLREIAEKKPAAFNKVHSDKNKAIAYFIDQVTLYKIFTKVGTRYLATESGEELGRDRKETIQYLKDSKNTLQLNTFKGQLRDALKEAGKPEDEDEEGAPAE